MHVVAWGRQAVVEVTKQFVSRLEYGRAVGASASVCCRQIHITGDGVTEVVEQCLSKDLGHDIGELFLRRDGKDLDGAVVDVLTQEMMPDVDVFGPFHSSSIFGDFDSGAVVFVDNTWLLHIDAHST